MKSSDFCITFTESQQLFVLTNQLLVKIITPRALLRIRPQMCAVVRQPESFQPEFESTRVIHNLACIFIRFDCNLIVCINYGKYFELQFG